MDDILEILREVTAPTSVWPEYQEKLDALDPYHDKVAAVLSEAYADELWSVACDVLLEECKEHFARGFRLGAQLMLLIAGPAAPDTRHKSWACR